MRTLAASVVAAVAVLAGCQTVQDTWSTRRRGRRPPRSCEPTKGNNVHGTVNFVQRGDKVRVSGQGDRACSPNSEVGFHIHEAGDCSSGDGMSAKGHFNPQGKPHGNPASAERHAGDLPMLRADAQRQRQH